MTDVPVLLLTGRGSRRLEAEALDVAAGLLCRSGDRTGACNDCRRVARREHPDLLVAAPESSRRANTPAFDESSGSKETTIPTALVRALASDAFRLPYEASLRVLVLLDVDRTEAAAFSALLKVLEEPPSRARFVLTAARPRLLPPTILSRLVLRRLPSPSREMLVASLVARGLSAEEAAARAAFRPTGEEEAIDLDLAGERANRDALLEAVSGLLLSGSTGWALVLAGRLAADDAAATADRFGLLARILRDAVAAGTDPAGRTVLHAERYRDLMLLSEAGTGVLLEAASRALLEAADLPDSRRNPRLAAESYALSLLAL
jgi:DNA polymerase-3 subunit delta'